MKIELWILVDNYGRIYYSSSREEDLKDYTIKGLNIIKLEGVLNV